LRDLTYIVNRVAGAAIYITQLRANDCRTAKPRDARGPHSTLGVHWYSDNTLAPESEQSERFEHSGVYLIAYHNADRRRSKEPILFYIPSNVFQERGPGSS
jgi:hypothetical protein